MPQAKDSIAARVDQAIKALEAIHSAAVNNDNRLRAAEQKAVEATEAVEQARKKMDEALGKLNDREQRIVDVAAENQSRIATLEAEKVILAQRDREARDELEPLRSARFRSLTFRRSWAMPTFRRP